MDEKQAEYLVAQYADLLLRIGYTWLGDMDDAKDVCQEVLIRLLENPRDFPDPGQERAWVIRLGVNACKNWRRSAWLRRRAPLEEGLALASEDALPEEGGLLSQVMALPPQVPGGHLPALLRGVRGPGDRGSAGAIPRPGEHPSEAGEGKTAAYAGRYGVCVTDLRATGRSWTGCA